MNLGSRVFLQNRTHNLTSVKNSYLGCTDKEKGPGMALFPGKFCHSRKLPIAKHHLLFPDPSMPSRKENLLSPLRTRPENMSFHVKSISLKPLT